jgi:uncharacterized protein YkwD
MNKLRRFFIPSPRNNFRPDALERSAALVMLVLVLMTFAMANVQSLALISSQYLVSTILPVSLVSLTNDERTAHGVKTLTRSTILDAAARLKAEDMVAKGYFEHDSPEGVTPWHWFKTVGYDYVYAGENLAVHFTDSTDVVSAWMNSPGHRQNILNDTYTEIGIGTARGVYKGAPTVFVVQMFGAQKTSTAQDVSRHVAASNTSGDTHGTADHVQQTDVETASPSFTRTHMATDATPSLYGSSTPTTTNSALSLGTPTPFSVDDAKGTTHEAVLGSDVVQPHRISPHDEHKVTQTSLVERTPLSTEKKNMSFPNMSPIRPTSTRIKIDISTPIQVLYEALDEATILRTLNAALTSEHNIAQAVPRRIKPSERATSSVSGVTRESARPTSAEVSNTRTAQHVIANAQTRSGAFLARLLSSPHTTLSLLYLLLSLAVTLILVCAVVFEWRRQHPVQVVYGVGLLAVMFFLFTMHLSLTSGVVIG